MEDNAHFLNRRDFISKTAKGAAAVLTASIASSIYTSCSPFWKFSDRFFYPPDEVTPVEPIISDIRSVVGMVSHSQAVAGNGKIDKLIAQRMIDEAVKSCTGQENIEEAWNQIFPQYKDNETIGIKLNCLNSKLSTHREVVDAIVNNLTKVGVRENNIIIWEMFNLDNSGYELNDSEQGVRCLETIGMIGYDEKERLRIPSHDFETKVSKILTQMCDYVINANVLKDNNAAGISSCIKNFHGVVPPFPIKMHPNNCNPQLAELYDNPVVKNKTKLHINDALLGIFQGGPMGSPQWTNNQVLISTDPVAIDYHTMMIIEEKRKEKGLRSILAKSKHIQSAAEMGLGTNNPQQIELREIKLG